ncbi:EAL domain-containing protein [Novosphingobium aquiterrae]|uniref:EAL domain-containing protein n=1 Tax=Novosphingobium aquiterrae TaxID=624388 RepID=A0ABV6PFH2_9SPHN
MVAQQARQVREPEDVQGLRASELAPKTPAAQAQMEPLQAPRSRAISQVSSPSRKPARADIALQIVPNWILMAPTMIGAALLNGVAIAHLPRVVDALLIIIAIAAAALTPAIAGFERRHVRRSGHRQVLKVASVSIPMALFGIGVSGWTASAALANVDSIGLLVIVSSLATLILNRRIVGIVSAQVGLWGGVALQVGSFGSYFALAVGVIVGVYLSHKQSRADALEENRLLERERRQVRAEEILNDYEQTGQGWFWETDRRGAVVYVSHTVAHVLECNVDDLVGRPMADLFDMSRQGQENERTLAFHFTARSAFADLALRAATPEEERWWSLSGRPIYDSFGNFLGYRGSGSDLTEKRRSAEHASRLAHYDSLTGLANRFQMSQTLEKILSAPNLSHRACAVFLLDLDRFKQVNDTMGHPAGDNLLTQVAKRLERAVGQVGRVGRLGGDEFQVVLPGHHQREDLAQLARRVINDLSEPYSIDSHRVVIGVSVGIALSPDDGVTSEAIIRNADLALYAAKDGGRGRHHFYASDLHSDAEERRQLEQDLRDALGQGGLELYYQPVVHTSTERITGFEALLRWRHPVRGPMSPAKFIPIAEDSGLITQIGEWALRTACRDLANWPEAVRVAVNVSPLQFANPNLPAVITNALASAQVNPNRLELEITESVFLNDDEGTDAMFASLKRIGVRLALDDFGTGYSSLGYLKKAPFDKIKIDQSFVRGATITGSRNGAIIASIVSLAEALGMETTAEGVETLDELDLVRMLGCSHVQGYIYEKPLSLAQATETLRVGTTAIAKGPRAARAVRHTLLRKIVLEHGGQTYHGTIRNISATGALVEGLWNVPPGTIFRIMLAEGEMATATARWCQEDRMGVEFSSPLELDQNGRITFITPGAPSNSGRSLKQRSA